MPPGQTKRPKKVQMPRKSNRKKKKSVRWPYYVLATVTLLAIGVFLAYKKLNPTWYNINKNKYPITGIDVSKHTGRIDWEKVREQQVHFAYIKATEGVNYLDPKYKVNYQGAKASGLKTGAYHFFRFNKPGKEQAENFLKHAHLEKEDLPPVIDVEDWGNKHHKKTPAQISEEIKTFIEIVEKRTGREVVIYTNESSYNSYIADHFDSSLIWICTFRKEPLLEPDRWIFWQHSHDTRLEGVEGWVDWNTFNGNEEAWRFFAQQTL
ncbi:lysozyme [Pontibacter qinzhouensis]|uniref:Lysozyme n=2 Tax=Pontibacter qinzhouensis TaxID=2603253 RepID=A0A5C8KBG5_9BACT|nr:lysozyme [Pontibacter qinzhouensis]